MIGHCRCGATGESVEAARLAEQRRLQPLPLLPEVFDVVVTLPVHDDCTVNFENRSYGVPFRLCGLSVEFADVRKSCGWFTRATWRLNILAAAGDDY